MRFITEFEISESEINYARAPIVDHRKLRGESDMGKSYKIFTPITKLFLLAYRKRTNN
jgi:hypothetical protein